MFVPEFFLKAKLRIAFGSFALVLVATAGCVRTKGRNADCRWPGEVPLSKATPAHLSADAEFAEDLAIRYADVHFGLRTPGWISEESYNAARDGCMSSLFDEVAKQHGVATEKVSTSLGLNRGAVDMAINFPIVLLCLCLASLCGRFIWRKYPVAEHGWIPGAVMASFIGVALALGCTMVGEMWGFTVETYRIGNDHLSYRATRLWWARHEMEAFVVALVVDLVAVGIAGFRSQAGKLARPSRGDAKTLEINM